MNRNVDTGYRVGRGRVSQCITTGSAAAATPTINAREFANVCF
ncbi:MAG: hypothetical protein R3C59_05435 [Planctomycetaceae bacterium]